VAEAWQHLFALVCGQNPAHTWSPGGALLPCCQRCTGLYAGAIVALLLHLALRIRPSARFLQVHGLFLLQMVPLGFHWVAQDALVRTWSGLLYGFGLVSFLWLLPGARVARSGGADRRRWTYKTNRTYATYGTVLGLTLAAVPVMAAWGGVFVGRVLVVTTLAGLAVLGALVTANLALGLTWLVSRRHRTRHDWAR
jgi:uncharacterized membrane protein